MLEVAVFMSRPQGARLQAGTLWVNSRAGTVAAVPIGGIGTSGYRREIRREALALYSQTMAVCLR